MAHINIFLSVNSIMFTFPDKFKKNFFSGYTEMAVCCK